MEKSKKVYYIVFIAILVLVVSLSLFGCKSNKKKGDLIPYGSYAMYVDGEILQTPMEYVWLIYSEIECMYAKYDFVAEDDGTMYFKCQSEQKQKYLVKYDEETEILSIYLPREMYTDHQSAIFSDEYIWMYYKRK